MTRNSANWINRLFGWALLLAFAGGLFLFAREMGVKIPPEIISFLGGIKDAIFRLVGGI
jgi:uncharacterized membrane protein